MKKILAMSMTILASACGQNETIKTKQADYLDVQKTEVVTNGELSPSQTIKALDQKLANAGKITKPEQVKFTAVNYDYEPSDEIKKACQSNAQNNIQESGFCPSIDIKLAKIEPRWIEQVVNKKITNDDNPKLLKFKQKIDEFISSYSSDISEKERAKDKDEQDLAHGWTLIPQLIPAHLNVAQVVISRNINLGGVDGVPSMEYLMFDMDLQSQIDFSDVVAIDRLDDFYELADVAFKNHLKNERQITSKKDIKEYEKSWQFEPNKNIYFGKNGMILVYHPSEMGDFEKGVIEITLPYDDLQGIIKDKYLPNKVAHS